MRVARLCLLIAAGCLLFAFASACAPVGTQPPPPPSAPTNTPVPVAVTPTSVPPTVTPAASPTTAATIRPTIAATFTPQPPTSTPPRPTNTPPRPTATNAPSNNFLITVKTGNDVLASTNARVYITLIGSLGQSGEVHLDNPLKNDFERGMTSKFDVTTRSSIGVLERIRIRHDNSGLAAGWFLDFIIVENKDTQQRWLFTANRWLATGEGDGKIDITLIPDK